MIKLIVSWTFSSTAWKSRGTMNFGEFVSFHVQRNLEPKSETRGSHRFTKLQVMMITLRPLKQTSSRAREMLPDALLVFNWESCVEYYFVNAVRIWTKWSMMAIHSFFFQMSFVNNWTQLKYIVFLYDTEVYFTLIHSIWLRIKVQIYSLKSCQFLLPLNLGSQFHVFVREKIDWCGVLKNLKCFPRCFGTWEVERNCRGAALFYQLQPKLLFFISNF